MKVHGVFGGTFDPIHFGHLRPVLEVLEAFELQDIRFVPCGLPPHGKSPVAPAPLRLKMVSAAIAAEPRFALDERELQRSGPSYTVDTLESMRDEQPNHGLVLIVGLDSFAQFRRWHRYERILELAHLIVMRRPADPEIGESTGASDTDFDLASDPAELTASTSGKIFELKVTQLALSSSMIRGRLRHGQSPRFAVPDAVADIIEQSGCYGPPAPD